MLKKQLRGINSQLQVGSQQGIMSLHQIPILPGHLLRERGKLLCFTLVVIILLVWGLCVSVCVCLVGGEHKAFYTLPRPTEELAAMSSTTQMWNCELQAWEEMHNNFSRVRIRIIDRHSSIITVKVLSFVWNISILTLLLEKYCCKTVFKERFYYKIQLEQNSKSFFFIFYFVNFNV